MDPVPSSAQKSAEKPYDPKPHVDMRYLLSSSDVEPMELLRLADDDCTRLWTEATLKYTHGPGEAYLLQEAARVCDVSPSDVQICPPQMAIYITTKVVMNRCRR